MRHQIVYAVPNEKPFVIDQSDSFSEQPRELLITPHVFDEVQLDDDCVYEVAKVRHFPPAGNYTNFARAFAYLQSLCKDTDERDVNPDAGRRCRETMYITIIVLKQL